VQLLGHRLGLHRQYSVAHQGPHPHAHEHTHAIPHSHAHRKFTYAACPGRPCAQSSPVRLRNAPPVLAGPSRQRLAGPLTDSLHVLLACMLLTRAFAWPGVV
jgi:hypothetical protein